MLCGVDSSGNGKYTTEGVVAICDMLKVNSSLTSLSYAPRSLNSSPKCQDPLTVSSHPSPCSLDVNNLTNSGKDMSGILQLAESLKVNSSLTSLSYVLHSLNSSPKCQGPLTAWL